MKYKTLVDGRTRNQRRKSSEVNLHVGVPCFLDYRQRVQLAADIPFYCFSPFENVKQFHCHREGYSTYETYENLIDANQLAKKHTLPW